jgi:HK97 family phage major capsid protein
LTELEIKNYIDDIKSHNARIIAGYDKRLDEFDTEFARLKSPDLWDRGQFGKGLPTAEDKAFVSWLRKGDRAPEAKVLTVGSDASAWYMCPPQLSSEIYSSLTEGNPLRSLARVYQTDKNSLEVLKRSANGAVVLQSSEVGEILETTGLAYEKLTFTPATQVYLLKVSNIELEDNAYNAGQEFTSAIGEAHAVYECTAQTAALVANIGDGTLNTYAHTAAGSTSVISGDNIINLTFSIPTRYLANARFVMNRTVAAYIRTLKDAVTGAYLWNSLLTGEDRDRLCGFPVTICDDFPAMTSALYPIAFGDLRKGFAICDRFPSFQIQRLAERFAEFGITGFLSRFRTISGPLDGAAIHWLQMSAS